MFKRLTLFLTILLTLALAGTGWAAEYHVNTVTGSNANAGTAIAPWLNGSYGMYMSAAGDTLNIVAPATSPDRYTYATSVGGVDAGHPVIIQGSASVPANLMASVDVSHGATIQSQATPGNLITNGNIEAWKDATTLWPIGSVAGTKESTIVHGGTNSIVFVRAGTTLYHRFSVYLPAATEFTFSYWHYENAGSVRPKYSITETDPSPDKVLQSDGTFVASAYTFDPNDNSYLAWKKTTKTFTTDAAGNYSFVFSFTSNASYYIDDIELIPTITTHQWTQHSEDIFKLSDGYVSTVRTFAKCTNSAWTTSGAAALQYVSQAASLAAITAGQWWFESGVLYYQLAAGETISTLHIEAGNGSGTNGFTIANNYNTLNYLNFYGGNQHDFYITGNGNIFNNVFAYLPYSCGFYSTGTGEVFNHCYGKWTYNEDLFEVAAGDATANWCQAEYSYDDGFFAIGTGVMTCNYCLSNNNGLQHTADNSGFGIESLTAKMYLNNCDSINNYGRSIQIGANAEWSVYNTIAYGSQTDVDAFAVDAANFNKTIGHTNNIFGSKHANWILDASESLADPKLVNAAGGNYHLLGGSPAYKTGAIIAGMTVDYAGATVGNPPNKGIYEGIIGGSPMSPGLGLGLGNQPPPGWRH